MRSYCPACGSSNDPRNIECRACGESLDSSAFGGFNNHKNDRDKNTSKTSKHRNNYDEIPDYEELSEDEIESFIEGSGRSEKLGEVFRRSQRNK